MSDIFVYAQKPGLAAEFVTFGKLTGRNVFALAFSADEARALGDCGADGVLELTGADETVVENNAKSTAAVLASRNLSLLIVEASPRGRDLAARIAGYLDCAMVSDISEIAYEGGTYVTTRMLYGGAVQQKERFAGPLVVTMGCGRFEPTSGTPAVEQVPIQPDTRVTFIDKSPLVKEGTDLTKEKIIISVGMGLRERDDLSLVERLAHALQGCIGCTRGLAEERKWIPAEQYIGLSGSSVSPDLYIAVGISGQVQHLVGIRDSKLIVAINKNVDAPIFKASDYGIVGDLYEVVPLLSEAIEGKV